MFYKSLFFIVHFQNKLLLTNHIYSVVQIWADKIKYHGFLYCKNIFFGSDDICIWYLSYRGFWGF